VLLPDDRPGQVAQLVTRPRIDPGPCRCPFDRLVVGDHVVPRADLAGAFSLAADLRGLDPGLALRPPFLLPVRHHVLGAEDVVFLLLRCEWFEWPGALDAGFVHPVPAGAAQTYLGAPGDASSPVHSHAEGAAVLQEGSEHRLPAGTDGDLLRLAPVRA